MATYRIQGQTLTEIADAIRLKMGTAEKYTPEQMAEAIQSVNISLQEKTVSPSPEVQIVVPDNEYYGLSAVTVEAVAGELVDVEGVLF